MHIYEKLPFPFGLIRYGVAPDHLPIKNTANEYTNIAHNPNFKYFGNVTIVKNIFFQKNQFFY